MVVVWTEFAEVDLYAIFSYVAKTSPYYAHIVRDSFLSVAKSLKLFPTSGRKVPELMLAEYREKFIYSYRMIYRISEQKIYIVALVHMRQQFDVSQF